MKIEQKLLALLFLMVLLSGCVRMSGGAGYWKSGEEDEPAELKSVNFDSNRLIPGNQS